MARPVTLFTGQWADLPLEQLCKKGREFGYDGLELACWGDHFEVDKALSDDTYCARKRELLEKYDLQLFAVSNHLVGQAVLDNIDARHKTILPEYVWGNGDPKGVNQRAIEEMKNTARAAQKLGVDVVNGFTGSSIWHLVYDFPPTPPSMIWASIEAIQVLEYPPSGPQQCTKTPESRALSTRVPKVFSPQRNSMTRW